MAATIKRAGAEDINVALRRLNRRLKKRKNFAQNISRITELKEEIEVKKETTPKLRRCFDTSSDWSPCVFTSHSREETGEMLEEAKENLQEVDALESRVESFQWELADLKVQLCRTGEKKQNLKYWNWQ
uniref:Uncharacterized protein n=1 Tax=Monodon monoceros TaxID=40151 RepID=A0A8C6C0P8_MONMO